MEDINAKDGLDRILWIFFIFLPSLMEARKFSPAGSGKWRLDFPMPDFDKLYNLQLISSLEEVLHFFAFNLERQK